MSENLKLILLSIWLGVGLAVAIWTWIENSRLLRLPRSAFADLERPRMAPDGGCACGALDRSCDAEPRPMTSPQGQDQPASRPFRLYGFATGDYMCKCMTCGETFIGDKRAVTCLPCAADQAEASRTPPPAVSEVREAVARIIETVYWPLVDERGPGANGYWDARIKESLAKADSILALPLPRMGGEP